MFAKIRADMGPPGWPWLVGLALFATIVSAKLWAIRAYGSDLPYWDQWPSEWERLLLPWQRGTLTWANFYREHNEHRVVLTKGLSLAVVALNSQWDVRLQLCVNALLHAGIALGLFLWLARHFAGKPALAALWALALAIAFAPPHSFENVLSGFHSQQYLLLGLSLLGIERTLRSRPGSAGWWIGLGAMTLALLSMASALLAAATVIFVLLLFSRCSFPRWRPSAVTALGCVVLCAVGWAMTADAPHHEYLRVHSWHDFLGTLRYYVTWPAMDRPAFAALSFAPLLALAIESWRRRRPLDSKEVTLVAFGVWVFLQIAATAYARGANSAQPASRYLDTLLLGLLFNFAAGLILFAQRERTKIWTIAVCAGMTLWCVVVGRGLLATTQDLFAHRLPARIKTLRQCEQNVRLYLATGDAKHLAEPGIPFPGTEEMKKYLDQPETDRLMPVSIRRAMKIEVEEARAFAAGNASPLTPPFPAAANFGSFPPTTMATWISRPIAPPQRAFLKFEVAGDASAQEIALELWSADSKTRLGQITASKEPGESWRAAYVRAPRETFRIVARDASATAWVAFTAPVEMAAGSYWCWRLTEHAPLLFWFSGASTILALGLSLIPRRETRGANFPGDERCVRDRA